MLLEPAELLLRVCPERVRDLAVATFDDDVHATLPVEPCTVSRRAGRSTWRSPSGRPGLRPHTRLLRLSQLLRHYPPSRPSRRVGRRGAGDRKSTRLNS